MVQVFLRNATTCILCLGFQWCGQCLGLPGVRGARAAPRQTGSEAAPCTAPAIFYDFWTIYSAGLFRKTIGFAGGWGGFMTAQLNLPSKGNSDHIHPCTFIQSWKITSELKNISGHSLRQVLFGKGDVQGRFQLQQAVGSQKTQLHTAGTLPLTWLLRSGHLVPGCAIIAMPALVVTEGQKLIRSCPELRCSEIWS